MKRILERLVVIVGVSGGLLAAVETAANAGISLNHSEPVARDLRWRSSADPWARHPARPSQNHRRSNMKRILQRLVVIVGLSGGLIAAVQTAADARIGLNHTEPVARDHR